MSRTFSSLAVPNYRRFWIGTTISHVGNWMAVTAQSWLVLVDLTNGNASALGWLAGITFAPALFFAPLAGWLADRAPKQTIMLATQVVMAAAALLLGWLVMSGHVRLWHVFAIAAVDGIASALDGPARQAFVSELVPREQLANAISLNSAGFNGARLVGPGVAGALIAILGTGPAFIANGLSYGALILALMTLESAALQPAPASRGRRGLREGIRYVRSRPDLVLLLSMAFVMGTFGFNFAVSNPLMTTAAFGKGPGEFGLLGTVMGAGALGAALLSARRGNPRIRHVIIAMALFTVVEVFSALAPTYEVFAALMLPVGLTAITVMVTANSLVQRNLPPGVRGRVMALWTAVVMGGSPFVTPVVGWIGDTFGPRWTVAVGAIAVGIMTGASAIYLLRSDRLRIAVQRVRPWVKIVPIEGGGAPNS